MIQAAITAYTTLLDEILEQQGACNSPAMRILLGQLATSYRAVLDQLKAKHSISERPAEDLIEGLVKLESTHHDPAIRAIASRCAAERRFP